MKNCLIAETQSGKIEIDLNQFDNSREIVALIATIAENPEAEVKYTYHEDGINGGKDTDQIYTAKGYNAILYISEFFNADSFADAVINAAVLTESYQAEEWLITSFLPAE